MQVPDHDVSITAAGEADLVVGTDGQSVAGRSRGRQFGLDPWSRRGQVPDGQCAGFTSNYQGPPIWENLTRSDVVVSILIGRKGGHYLVQLGWQIPNRRRFTLDADLTKQSSWAIGLLLPGWLISQTLTQPFPPV